MSNNNNFNLGSTLGGIAAIITAVGGIYGIYINHQNKTVNLGTDRNHNTEVPKPTVSKATIDYRCNIKQTTLFIDEDGTISPYGRTFPGSHNRCKFDIVHPDGTKYCVNRDDGAVLVGGDHQGWSAVGQCTS